MQSPTPLGQDRSLPAPSGAGQFGQSVVASLGEGYGLFSVRDRQFAGGAKGDDATNDTLAFQAAIAAASVATSGGLAAATVIVPPGRYIVSTGLILPDGVRIVGFGTSVSQIRWTGAAGFAIQVGNNANVLSGGNAIIGIGILVMNTAAHGVLLFAVEDCFLQNVYIEGRPGGLNTTVGVQIDGANISAFFILLENVHCNHVFKGFVHTSSGTVQPTQVTGINCVAFCDSAVGSIGIDIQTVGALACGDGVVYVGGDMESCATGVRLDARGSTIHSMRFENQQGVATDILLTANAKANVIHSSVNAFTLTDNSNDPSNQWFGVSKGLSAGTMQANKLGDTAFSTPTAIKSTLITSGANNPGAILMQNGQVAANDGGGLLLYGQAHSTFPNHVVAGIGANGKFRVNGSGVDGGTDWLTVDRTTGFTTLANASVSGSLRHIGSTLCFYNAAPVAKPTVTGSKAANAALTSLMSALATLGLVTDSTT